MAKEVVQFDLPAIMLDKRVLGSVFQSVQTLAALAPRDYRLQASFLQGVADMVEPGTDYLTDAKIGMYTEHGQAGDKRRFIWLDESMGPTVAAHGGDEDLQGRIEFAKVANEHYFFGAITLHTLANQQRELKVEATGFRPGFDDAVTAQIAQFAVDLGVQSLWSHIPVSTRANNYETRFYGYASKPLARNIDHALKDMRGLPRP